jgi:hypothetical protein
MGYYSDVRSMIYGPADQIDALVAAESMGGNVLFVGEAKKILTRREDMVALWYRDERVMYDVLEINGDFSWADDSTFVQHWLRMLDKIDDGSLPFKLAYEFVRVGENDDDVERREGGDTDVQQHALYPTIKIVCMWDE